MPGGGRGDSRSNLKPIRSNVSLRGYRSNTSLKFRNKPGDAVEETPPPVPYYKLYRYGRPIDFILLAIGVVCAIAAGMSMPVMTIAFGDVANAMVRRELSKLPLHKVVDMCGPYLPGKPTGLQIGNLPQAFLNQLMNRMRLAGPTFIETVFELALIMVYIAGLTFVANFVFIACFNILAENQAFRIRKLYLEALLRQNVGWYDTVRDRNFVSRMSEDLMKVQAAIGEKVGLCIYFSSTFLMSIGNAFYHGWLMTLVVLVVAPVLAITASIVSRFQAKIAATEQASYARAAMIAQEALTNIKTVMAFSGRDKEVEWYVDALKSSKKAGRKGGLISSIGMGLMWFIIYCSYAIAFGFGMKLVIDSREQACNGKPAEYEAKNMIVVFFNVVWGAFHIGQTASAYEAFATGKGAAASIFAVIDRVPEIDSYSEAGKKPEDRPQGHIEFKGVEFSYPARPDIQILKNFNLTVEPGHTVALVGHSGCGKSTLIQLLQRFYDPSAGSIFLDGERIDDLHIGWLRSQIGVVSQEPVLFNTTIAENIRYGRDGVTDDEIMDACKQANAHGFINKLPKRYETVVGDRGAALSGGQKQRIAIARSLVRNPALLLLDEATSALDTQSEAIVSAALEKAQEGRTTLIVAHRLSTIRNADVIVAIQNGQVKEMGSHAELLQQRGLYYSLVLAQMHIHTEDGQSVTTERAIKGAPEMKKSVNMDAMSFGASVSSADEILQAQDLPVDEEALERRLVKETSTFRILHLNHKEWPLILVGTISAMIQGSVMPAYAVIVGNIMAVMAYPDEQKARDESLHYSMAFLLIGVLAGGFMFLQMFMFNLAGGALTQRLRKMSFASMLQQELGWFDEPQNNTGSLCARLSGDAASVQGATGTPIGISVQAVSTIAVGIGVGMYFKWKLGLVAAGFVPLVLLSTYFQAMLLFGSQVGEKKAVEEASKVAVQAVANIRTVASLCKERAMAKMYLSALQKAHDDSWRLNLVRGALFGLSQSIIYLAYASLNSFGAKLVQDENMPYGDIFKVSQAVIMGTMMVGQMLSLQPDYNKAKISGARVLALIARQPKIDTDPRVGKKIDETEGALDFKDVAFHYPTRTASQILKGLTLHVEPGTSVALVGPSGCGKSTTIQLILRYYDPVTGTVMLDEQDISKLQVDSLRSQMAIVAQEPALFDRTIAENIAYGDNSRAVPMDEVVSAAKMANIHNFIMSLPAGYDTRVGEMGTQLSGGQKQRVAIARALVRNPKIILLDEATSALDTESEKLVQAALDKASHGRTSITIAHRLSSIQNVQKIIVINHGRVYEEGTHHELLEKKGLYNRLWSLQGNS